MASLEKNAFAAFFLLISIVAGFVALTSSISHYSSVNHHSQLAALDGAGSGLVGWWKLDDGSGTSAIDSSGNNNTGNLVNSPTWATGQIGGALSFNGASSYIETPSISGTGLTSMSYSFWVKTAAMNATNAAIVSWASQNKVCKIRSSSQNISCLVNGSNTNSAISNTPINNDVWHFVVYTSTNDAQIIYLDGVQQGSGSQPLSTASGLARIGANSGTAGSYFNGSLDDIRIYNRALSASEIADLYNQGLSGGVGATPTPTPMPTPTPTPATDMTAPTVPSNLISSDITQTSATISWSASTDASGIEKYNVYRNGSLLASSTATSYTDATLSANTTFQYTITATDASPAENTSAQSAPLTITTLITLPSSSVPTIFKDQFETGDLYAWTSMTTGGGGTVSAVSFPTRSGLYSFSSYIPNSTVSRSAYLVKAFISTNPVYFRFSVNLANDINIPVNSIIWLASPAATGVGSVYQVGVKNKSGNLILTDSLGNEGLAISKNQWHVIELAYTQSGPVTTSVDGTPNLSVATGSGTAVNELRLGLGSPYSGTGGTAYFDDVTVANQARRYSSQELSLIHANFFGHLAMKILVVTSGASMGNKLTASLTGDNGYYSQLYSNSGPITGREQFILNLRNLTTANYTLVVRLLDASNAVLSEVSETFNKPYDGIPKVGIDENNAININGTPTFLVTPYALDSRQINTWASQGYINVLYGTGFGITPWTKDGYAQVLATGNSVGLLGGIGPLKDTGYVSTVRYPGDTNPQLMPTESVVSSYASSFQGNPYHLGYIWGDEPVTNFSINADMVRNWTAWSHTYDPQHIVFSNEYGARQASAESDAWFIAKQHTFMYPNLAADVNIFDTYPIEYANKGYTVAELAQIADWYKNWNFDLVPFMAFVETCDAHPEYVPNTPAPTPEQVKMLAWINVVHGAKGISWYHYQGVTPPANFVEMAKFTRQVTDLGSVILGPDSTRIISDDANSSRNRVDTLLKETPTDIWIFAVRVTEITEANPISVQLSVQNGGTSALQVYDESRTINMSGGTFQDTFLPNAVHIYRISKSGSFPTPTPTPTPTPIPTPTPTSPPTLSADLNGNGRVNAQDFSILLSYWGITTKPPADINQNGIVNAQDFSIMLSQWTG